MITEALFEGSEENIVRKQEYNRVLTCNYCCQLRVHRDVAYAVAVPHILQTILSDAALRTGVTVA